MTTELSRQQTGRPASRPALLFTLLAMTLLWLTMAQGASAQYFISFTSPESAAKLPAGQEIVVTGTHGLLTDHPYATLSFGASEYTVPLSESGRWSYTVPAMPAGRYQLRATAPNGNNGYSVAGITIDLVDPPRAASAGVTALYATSVVRLTPLLSGGPATSLEILTGPTSGSVTLDDLEIVYMPPAGFDGQVTIDFRARGPGGISNTATATITIEAPPGPPDVEDMTIGFDGRGERFWIPFFMQDRRIDAMTIESQPRYGQAMVMEHRDAGYIALGYRSPERFSGTDSYTYSATGPGGRSAVATITINVRQPGVPVTPEATYPRHGSMIGPTNILTGRATPGDTVIIMNSSGLEVGRTLASAFGTFTFESLSNFPVGMTTLRLMAMSPNQTPSAVAEVTFEVLAAPVAEAITATVVADSRDQTIAWINRGGRATGAQLVDPPVHGTVEVNPTAFSYSPDPGYIGADDFTYRLVGVGGSSGPALVSITVSPQPTGAQNQSITLPPGVAPAPVDLTIGATGPVTDASIGAVAPPEAGTALLDRSGGQYRLLFAPNPAFTGTSTVPFTLTTATGSSSATVTFIAPLDVAAITARVEQRVDGFLATRAASLASGITHPSLRNRFGAGPGTVDLTPNGNSIALNFASSTAQLAAWTSAGSAAEALAMGEVDTRFNAWIDGSATLHLRGSGPHDSWGRFALVSLGADYLLNEGLLVGLALHGDTMRDENDQGNVEGSGFLIGPYVSMAVMDGLLLDAEISYGRSWNDLTGGPFSGSFETDRVVARLGLEGELALSDTLLLRPELSAFYLREEGGAFVVADRLGNGVTIDDPSIEQVRLQAGGRIEQAMVLGDGLGFTPYLGGDIGLTTLSVESLFSVLSTGFSLTGLGTVSIGSELSLNLDNQGLAAITARARLTAAF